MNRSCLVVHHHISDEATAHLCELLNDLAFAFDHPPHPPACPFNEHGRAGELTVTTSTVIVATAAVPVNAGARPALATLSDDGGTM